MHQKRKGVYSYIFSIFTLLLTALMATALSFVAPAQRAEAAATLEQKEFEDNAIILANSLLTHPALIHSESGTFYRASFDKDKLDLNLWIEPELDINNLRLCKGGSTNSGLCQHANSLPDSFSFVLISDEESGNKWFSILYPKEISNKLSDKIQCLSNFRSGSIQKIFDDGLKTLLIVECKYNSATIMEKGFPASILYSDGDVNMGTIKVLVIE